MLDVLTAMTMIMSIGENEHVNVLVKPGPMDGVTNVEPRHIRIVGKCAAHPGVGQWVADHHQRIECIEVAKYPPYAAHSAPCAVCGKEHQLPI